jgi:ABC-2 type transport system ATP-binding protein
MNQDTAIKVEDLQKSYGMTKAVDRLSFTVRTGEIFGIVGPNGAGKTTTLECLEGLRRPDNGEVRVLGFNPQKARRALNTRIGVQLQESSLAHQIRVWEAMDLFASFYRRNQSPSGLLEQLGLSGQRDTAFSRLSGGQKQRLFIALALIHDPELLFLDELTTGLDPQGRRLIWELIRDINEQGKTIVLSTHFMEEAERLCDRGLIIDHGKTVVLDSPENLIRDLKSDHKVIFSVKGRFDATFFRNSNSVTAVDVFKDRVTVSGQGEHLVAEVVKILVKEKIRYFDLHTQQPNLEDVFLKLTGREIRG